MFIVVQVNIWVPQPEKQLDVIKVTGLVVNVQRAKQGVLERVRELQAEQEERVIQGFYVGAVTCRPLHKVTDCQLCAPLSQALRSFKVTISVDPKFHPKIIGRKGAVISQIRKDHDVSIQFPDKGDEQQVCALMHLCNNEVKMV